ncbi:hypothetical protein AWB81_07568 [Caballeronia arationis]|jgi:hypothetical protein|nr:hypothetical protein AWB81_07568 [Caballeronia arationis]
MFAWHVDVSGTQDVNMAMGRPKAELVLSEDERSQWVSIARSRSNYDSRKHPKVETWLSTRPRCNMHFIPTYSP